MTAGRNELFIGISITVATLVVIVGILFLQQSTLFQKGLRVYMTVEDSRGVAEGSEIVYRGVHAGTVTGTDLRRDSVALELSIREVPAVPDDSEFVIQRQSLLSGKVVQIYPGTSTENIAPGTTVKGQVRGDLVEVVNELGRGVKGLENDIGKVLADIGRLVDKNNRGSLPVLLQAARQAVDTFNGTLAKNRHTLAQLLENMRKMSDSKNRRSLSGSLANLEDGTAELVQTMAGVQKASQRLNTLLQRLESGKGTAGKLLKEAELHRELERTLKEVKSLLRDIRKNPEKYISVTVF